MSKPNVLIGTPAYGGNVHTDFIHSLMGIEAARDNGFLEYSLMTITNESLITRARNSIMSKFYNDMNFSHLFYVDSDLGFPKETLPYLLNAQKDVIGVPVPLKGYDQNGNHVLNIGNVLSEPDQNGILEVEHVGNALLMFSRKAAKALCDNADTYSPSGLTRGHKSRDTQYDVFQVGVQNGTYLSEDYFVCHKLRQLGFKIYVHGGISVKHNGNFTFQSQ